MNINNLFLVITLLCTLSAMIFNGYRIAVNNQKEILNKLLYLSTTVLIATLTIRLFIALLQHEYIFTYVYNNTSDDLGLTYLISALWAGHQGSFLFWLLFINISGLIALNSDRKNSHYVTLVILTIQFFFLVVLLKNSPFEYIWETFPEHFSIGQFPVNGKGLNPLLKNPWMIIHPSLLLIGYATGVMPFIYSIIYLVTNDEKTWLKKSRTWLFISMVFLTGGIVTGAYWSYAVLGWGGYWGWDPVENSSLVPWLIGIALIHTITAQKKFGSLKRANPLIAMFYYILILTSTFLTRSGILSDFSVHSFSDSGISLLLFLFLFTVVLFSVTIYIARFKTIPAATGQYPPFHPDSILRFTSVIFFIFAFIILLGTLSPLLTALFMSSPATVQSSKYNIIAIMFSLCALALLLLFSFMTRRSKISIRSYGLFIIVTIAAGYVINNGFSEHAFPLLITLFTVFCILLLGINCISLNKIPMTVCHTGLLVLFIGIAVSSYHKQQYQLSLEQGISKKFNSSSILFKGISNEKNSLQFMLQYQGKSYPVSTTYTYNRSMDSIYKEPYILSFLTHDIYFIPHMYISGYDTISFITLKKGRQKTFGNLRINFLGYDNDHGKGHGHMLRALLHINNKPVSTAIVIQNDQTRARHAKIPGTDRYISLAEIDMQNHSATFHISPGSSTSVPEDRAVVQVITQRWIILVWLGGLLITVGMVTGFFRRSGH